MAFPEIHGNGNGNGADENERAHYIEEQVKSLALRQHLSVKELMQQFGDIMAAYLAIDEIGEDGFYEQFDAWREKPHMADIDHYSGTPVIGVLFALARGKEIKQSVSAPRSGWTGNKY